MDLTTKIAIARQLAGFALAHREEVLQLAAAFHEHIHQGGTAAKPAAVPTPTGPSSPAAAAPVPSTKAKTSSPGRRKATKPAGEPIQEPPKTEEDTDDVEASDTQDEPPAEDDVDAALRELDLD